MIAGFCRSSAGIATMTGDDGTPGARQHAPPRFPGIGAETMKRIGIFTADLMTPAGPSRRGCWIAERLSRRYEVWLISRDRPTIESLGRNFGVSLANVRLLCLDAPGKRRFSVWNGAQPFVPRRAWNIVAQFLAYRRLANLKLDLFILNQSFHYMKPRPRGQSSCACSPGRCPDSHTRAGAGCPW